MELTRCRRQQGAARCSWCQSEIAWEADPELAYVLVAVRDPGSLEGHHGEFVEYPILNADRTAPAFVRLPDGPALEGTRTEYDLLFATSDPGCARALSQALEADENAVSIESWSGIAPREAGVRRPETVSSRSITLSSDRHFIILRIVGDYTRERAMTNTLEAHALGRELGIGRYLVDMTESRNALSVLANYEFARKDLMETPEIDKTALVAVLVRPDDHSHDFVETVARNSGLRVTLFRDRERAEDHLRSDG
jgi:hypothetical protein